jgi:hypothetical protein
MKFTDEYEYEVWFLNSQEPKYYGHYEKDEAEYEAALLSERWTPVELRVIKITRTLDKVVKYS